MMRLALAPVLALAAALAAQRPPAPATPLALPADWPARDLEGKWVAYRAALDAQPADKTLRGRWLAALGEANEFELLECIVLHEGWSGAGALLESRDAPQWLRAAVWNLANFDSHGQDLAKKVLLRHASRVRGWLEAHPGVLEGPVRAVHAQLVAQGVAAERDPRDLPPLDAMQVLVPWLDAPAELAEFGARTTAEPKVRYEHQVVRALGGVLAKGDADDVILTKVVALTRHPSARVQLAAFGTLAKLPPGLVPWQAVQRIVDDRDAAPERRRLAAMALSYSSHPAAFDALVAVALDVAHPAHPIALQRVGEVGDPVGYEPLFAAAEGSPELANVLAAPIARLNARRADGSLVTAELLHRMLYRAAWQRVAQDARAAATWRRTRQFVREHVAESARVRLLAAIGADPVPPLGPFRGAEIAPVAAAVVELVREIEAPPAGK